MYCPECKTKMTFISKIIPYTTNIHEHLYCKIEKLYQCPKCKNIEVD